jgi:hypothetical protein
MTATGGQLVTPDIFGAVLPAARSELPLGLGRQLLARPARIGLDVDIRAAA